jgi:SAM-dependent methyltransferase
MLALRLRPLSRRSIRFEIDFEPQDVSFASACRACTAGETQEPCCVSGVVASRRNMGHFIFVDLHEEDASGAKGGGDRLQVVVCPSELAPATALATTLLLRKHSRIRVLGTPAKTRTGECSVFARSLQLLGLPPEHDAVLKAARLVASSSEPSAAVVSRALGCELDELLEVVHTFEAADGSLLAGADDGDGEAPAAAKLARSIALRLRRAASSGVRQRERPPRFSPAEIALLRGFTADASDALNRAELVMHPTVQSDKLAPLEDVSLWLKGGSLSLENGLPRGLPAAELEVRRSYLYNKKLPQARWMLEQVYSFPTPPRRVLDLGCGKGDFTLLLAAAIPNATVLGVDTNGEAIASARQRARSAGLLNVSFRQVSATELLPRDDSTAPAADDDDDAPPAARATAAEAGESEEDTPLVHDLLVGLHACGGLSDVALSLAARSGSSCLVCTCCFNKHRSLCKASEWGAVGDGGGGRPLLLTEGEKDILCRMADCVDPSVSSEARRVISSIRLARLRETMRADRRVVSSGICTFPEAYSRQNFVLRAECAPCECNE